MTAPTLEEQLASERRQCPQCKLEISNPFVLRCPRCLTALPAYEPACSHCVHFAGCPVKNTDIEHDSDAAV